MRTYNNFRVLAYDVPSGEVTLAWYDDQQPYQGQLLLRSAHRIPVEAETNNWTREEFRLWWLNEINEQVADIPQFMKDEAHATYGYETFVAEPV